MSSLGSEKYRGNFLLFYLLNETIYDNLMKISNLKRETISFFVRISINPRTCAYVTPE